MPWLAALARAGVAAEAVEPVFPASSYPAHATLVTGLRTVEHGVATPVRLARGAPAAMEGSPLWDVVARAGGGVAALDWPSTSGAAIADLAPDLLVPAGETWADALATSGTGRVAELAARTGGAQAAAARPGPARDDALVAMACALLVAEPAPRLLLLRLSRTQAALAEAPPGSASVRAAIAAADADLGRLVTCLRDGGRLATSRSRSPATTASLPVHTELRVNVALAEAVAARDVARAACGAGRPSSSRTAARLRLREDAEAALLARQALEEAANGRRPPTAYCPAERDGRARIRIPRRGSASKRRWAGCSARRRGARLVPAGRNARGRLRSRPSRAWQTGSWPGAPGCGPGLRVPAMRQVDVAPTLAACCSARGSGRWRAARDEWCILPAWGRLRDERAGGR
jgi:hypothetical protein